jgi:hypothetical protein
MNMSAAATGRPLQGLVFALVLAMALLLLTAVQLTQSFLALVPDWATAVASIGLKWWGTPLGPQALAFVLAQVGLHAVLGLLAWGCACLIEVAWPMLRGRRTGLVALCFGAAALWVLVANAARFPWSATGLQMSFLGAPFLGAISVFDLLTAGMLGVVLVVLGKAVLKVPRVRSAAPRTLAYGAVLGMVVITAHLVQANGPPSGADPGRPNVIFIGIDSLRRDVVGGGTGLGVTPHLDAFLSEGAHQFSDAITPMARTFPSWISVLSGRYPRSTGARENLMPRSALTSFRTLPEILRERGYRTFYATDEVRFANIDESFGFDRVVTPTIGVADFLLGKASDLPLSNLVSNTTLGRWLFPATYSNRAVAHTYRPETFSSWLDGEIEAGGPQMLAIHFTLPHYPYRWAEPDDVIFDRSSDLAYQYQNAVIAADRQFGRLMHTLERKGLLNNALVAVLSDHGEALGIPGVDVLMRAAEVRRVLGPMRVGIYGHGTSVLSPHQYTTLLAFRGFGSAAFPMTARVHDAPVSLVDLAPTVLEMLGAPADAGLDGRSLRPIIMGEAGVREAFAGRARFTETGYRTALLEAGEVSETDLIGRAAGLFAMNRDTGRFEIRPDTMPLLLADKERAAITDRWLLASIPLPVDSHRQRFVVLDRSGATPARRLTSAPDPQSDPEVARLWRELHEHYGEELLPPLP